jgi:hypothetical protein
MCGADLTSLLIHRFNSRSPQMEGRGSLLLMQLSEQTLTQEANSKGEAVSAS